MSLIRCAQARCIGSVGGRRAGQAGAIHLCVLLIQAFGFKDRHYNPLDVDFITTVRNMIRSGGFAPTVCFVAVRLTMCRQRLLSTPALAAPRPAVGLGYLPWWFDV